MIEKISDFEGLSGVLSPLLPLLYTDFRFSSKEIEGVYIQNIDKQVTVAVSVKNNCANIVKIADSVDIDEISAFLTFMHIKNVVSDFKLGDDFIEHPLMSCELQDYNKSSVNTLDRGSVTKEYKSIFELLDDGNGEFSDWFPSFSKRINYGNAAATYIDLNGTAICCAVSPSIYCEQAVLGGVYTKNDFRQMGYGSLCVSGLLNTLYNLEVRLVSLWCEKHNIEFYEKLGFSLVGQVYIRGEF